MEQSAVRCPRSEPASAAPSAGKPRPGESDFGLRTSDFSSIGAWLLAACLAALAATLPAFAQTAQPQRIVNDAHHFAFTAEAGSIITYKEGGNGFTCFHQPQAGVKGDSEYGLLVFASPDYGMSEEGAKAAGLSDASQANAGSITTQERLNELVAADMKALKRHKGGDASIGVEGGKPLSVPFYLWQRSVGAKTHYALMYVVLQGGEFIAVQAENDAPFSAAQLDWLTGKLELLKLPATTAAPSASTPAAPPPARQ